MKHPRIEVSVLGHGDLACGASLVEFEPMRYRPRRELTSRLNSFDVVVMVAGIPSWANILRDVSRPCALQVASLAKWERPGMKQAGRPVRRLLRGTIRAMVGRSDLTGVRSVDHVIVMNDAMESWAAQSRGTEAHVSLIPPAIDTEVFQPRDPWSAEGPIVSVGRLGDSRKGWSRLIRCYGELLTARPGSPDLVLAGSGSLIENDLRLISELRLQERVRVYSDVLDTELVDLLQSASVFVQTSHEEGLGLAALEGMACGLPVVATATSGSRQYVRNGETGYLLPQDDTRLAPEFVSTIDIILADGGGAVGSGARQFCVDNYSRQSVLSRISGVVDELLVDSSGRE